LGLLSFDRSCEPCRRFDIEKDMAKPILDDDLWALIEPLLPQPKARRSQHVARIATEIARRGRSHGSGLGKTRWVAERTISWLHNFRRLRIGFERLAFIHEAFLKLACCIICWRQLKSLFC
jgi:transposase